MRDVPVIVTLAALTLLAGIIGAYATVYVVLWLYINL